MENNKRKTVKVVSIVLLIIAFCIIVPVVSFYMNTAEKSVDMANGVVNKTLSADNAIREYEWFKQQEADIRKCITNERLAEQELKNFTDSLPEDRSKWTEFDRREEASLRNSLTAIRRISTVAIEDFAARSSMANKAIFKDNLPSNLSRAFYAGISLVK